MPAAKYDYLPAPPEILERVTRIEAACECHAVPLAAAALQFPLGHPAVASVIPDAVPAGARPAQRGRLPPADPGWPL